ncbi:hypothetical protein LIER_19074 [Lithospermum erythrorhizon]|uniref:Uncharacterized protein n=1 Tax=Lithospermum erythrorhizon TaxID=34254 RepID=A0AAV3QIM6_LITER
MRLPLEELLLELVHPQAFHRGNHGNLLVSAGYQVELCLKSLLEGSDRLGLPLSDGHQGVLVFVLPDSPHIGPAKPVFQLLKACNAPLRQPVEPLQRRSG